MAELKTKVNDGSVQDFINAIEDEQKRVDSLRLLKIMEDITGEPSKMWGSSIVGFGTYRYKYASGREGDWMLTGFSPRKTSISIYIMSGFDKMVGELATLGKHKIGKGCLYIKRLDDIDEKVIISMIKKSFFN
jgi:hypothetical protein